MQIREMTPDDVGDVVSIEEASYGFHGVRKSFATACFWVSSYVVEHARKIVGYVIVVHGQAELSHPEFMRFPEAQEAGLGTRAFAVIMPGSGALSSSCIFLEVRSSNDKAKSLYESEFFQVISVKKDYYPAQHGREDALVYIKMLNGLGNIVTSPGL